ncbi:M28 family peptidase [Iamia sp. SCSIO 61187]|nr:M28 family peptidase [Iamia sp. SCSIO 61187]
MPGEDHLVAWVEEVCAFGIRRPGSAAGHAVERWVADEMRAAGLDVRLSRLDVPAWDHGAARLVAWPAGRPDDTVVLDGFPLPFTAATAAAGLEADVVLLRRDGDEGGGEGGTEAVRGAIAVDAVDLTTLPTAWMQAIATPAHDPGPVPDHLLPFGPRLGREVDDAIAGGAAGYVGALVGMPWPTRRYYVPYDAEHRALPAAWVDRVDGARLLALLAAGPVRGRLEVDGRTGAGHTHNVIGTLPGASDEWVVIGSHHDAPWASAVEDGTGIALVLAQARAWASVPPEARPHNLLFLLNGGHMTGGAGIWSFLERERALLDRTVLAVHLEHAAAAVEVVDGVPVATADPEAVWWFTSRDPALEATVASALGDEHVERAWILPPDVFGEFPPTDGGPLHTAGVPVVDVLSAPVYLFDEVDTVDKVHRPSLTRFGRAAARIVAATAGRTAAEARAAVVVPDGR